LKPDYTTMLSGMFALQSAALSAALATSGRLAGFALREAVTLLEPLRAPPELRQHSLEAAIFNLCEQNAEAFCVLAGFPRLWLLLFIGQLDVVRGRRPTTSASARTGE